LLCAAWTNDPDPQNWQSSPATRRSSFALLTYFLLGKDCFQGVESVFIRAFVPTFFLIVCRLSGVFD
jgi:hypothetical protein